jgi:hypothetical protein
VKPARAEGHPSHAIHENVEITGKKHRDYKSRALSLFLRPADLNENLKGRALSFVLAVYIPLMKCSAMACFINFVCDGILPAITVLAGPETVASIGT